MLRTLHATVHGPIWQPGIICERFVTVSESDFRYHDGSRPTMRDMLLKALESGDFRQCSFDPDDPPIFTVSRQRQRGSSMTTVTRGLTVSPASPDADDLFRERD